MLNKLMIYTTTGNNKAYLGLKIKSLEYYKNYLKEEKSTPTQSNVKR